MIEIGGWETHGSDSRGTYRRSRSASHPLSNKNGRVSDMRTSQNRAYRARLLGGVAVVAAGLALGVQAASAADAATETVIVTGSRLAVGSAYDAPTPVMVIGADDIKLAGTPNIESLLNQTPQFVGATNGG